MLRKGDVGMGLLNDKDLDRYLSLIGTYFATQLADNPEDEFTMGVYKRFSAVREHIYTLMENNGWYSVEDGLPKDGQDVLVYLHNGEETRIAPFNYDKGTWYDCVMNCTVAINSITHWMPLPEIPKEVSE